MVGKSCEFNLEMNIYWKFGKPMNNLKCLKMLENPIEQVYQVKGVNHDIVFTLAV